MKLSMAEIESNRTNTASDDTDLTPSASTDLLVELRDAVTIACKSLFNSKPKDEIIDDWMNVIKSDLTSSEFYLPLYYVLPNESTAKPPSFDEIDMNNNEFMLRHDRRAIVRQLHYIISLIQRCHLKLGNLNPNKTEDRAYIQLSHRQQAFLIAQRNAIAHQLILALAECNPPRTPDLLHTQTPDQFKQSIDDRTEQGTIERIDIESSENLIRCALNDSNYKALDLADNADYPPVSDIDLNDLLAFGSPAYRRRHTEDVEPELRSIVSDKPIEAPSPDTLAHLSSSSSLSHVSYDETHTHPERVIKKKRQRARKERLRRLLHSVTPSSAANKGSQTNQAASVQTNAMQTEPAFTDGAQIPFTGKPPTIIGNVEPKVEEIPEDAERLQTHCTQSLEPFTFECPIGDLILKVKTVDLPPGKILYVECRENGKGPVPIIDGTEQSASKM